LRGAVPPPAGARRGAPVRDHVPPAAPREEDDEVGARRRSGARAGTSRAAAQRARIGEETARAHGGRAGGDRVAARPRPARGLRAPARRRGDRASAMKDQALDVTVITGMSGAGRSSAADVLEDLGYFVIDNLPPALIGNVRELARDKEEPPRFALVVDVRSGEFVHDLEAALAQLRTAGARTRVLFLDASDDVP